MDWKDTLGSLLASSGALRQEDSDALSSDSGTGEPEGCAATASPRKGTRGRLTVVTEKKGRGGKTATIVCGFADSVSDEEIARLATLLRKSLSSGGSSRGGEILIQGDRRADVARILREEGFTVA